MIDGFRHRLASFIAPTARPPGPSRAVGARLIAGAIRQGIRRYGRGRSRDWETLPDEHGLIHALTGAKADRIARTRWTVYRATEKKAGPRRAMLAHIRRQPNGDRRRRAIAFAVGRGELEPMIDHPAERVITGFDGHLTGFDRQRCASVLLDACGEVYLGLARRHGTPHTGFVLPASWLVGQNDRIVRFRSPTLGRPLDLHPANVIRLARPMPSDPYRETAAPLEAMANEVEAVEAMAEKLVETIVDGGRPDLLLIGPGVSDDEDFDELWREKGREGLPFRLDHETDPELGGKIDAHQFGFDAESQQIKPIADLVADRAITGARTPRSVLGDFDGVTDPVMAAYIEARWVADVVDAALFSWRETFDARLMPQYRGYRDWALLDYSDPTPFDPNLDLKASRLAPHAPTVAEQRHRQGLDYKPGTEVHHVKGRMYERHDDADLVGAPPPPPAATASALTDLPLRSD